MTVLSRGVIHASFSDGHEKEHNGGSVRTYTGVISGTTQLTGGSTAVIHFLGTSVGGKNLSTLEDNLEVNSPL